jgi:hypothetical protein
MGFWLEMDFSLAEGNRENWAILSYIIKKQCELDYTELYYKKTT